MLLLSTEAEAAARWLTSEAVRQSSPVVQPPAAASVTPQPPQQRGHEEGFTSRLGRQVQADNQQLGQNI